MSSKSVSELIEQLSNPNLRMQQKAASELEALGIGAKDAFKSLISHIYNLGNTSAFSSLEVDLCISVLKAIIATEENSIVIRELVKQLVNNKSLIIQEEVANCLGEIVVAARGAIPELEAKFTDKDGNLNVRYASKISISRIKQTEIPINEIFFDVSNNNPLSREIILEDGYRIIAALRAFARLGKQSESALPKIDKLQQGLDGFGDRQSLNQEQTSNLDLVRLNTIIAIAKIKEVIPPINEILVFLENGNSEVRKVAIIFLNGWGNTAINAIDTLKDRISTDTIDYVRIEAFNTVIKILKDNHKVLIQELVKGLSNSDPKICIRAIWELEFLEEEAREALPRLREIILRNEWEIVKTTFNTIKTILYNEKEELQNELISNIYHPFSEIKLSAIQELNKLGCSLTEYFDQLLILAATKGYDQILREAIQLIISEVNESILVQKYIDLLENENLKLIPYELLEDLNISTNSMEKIVKSLWNYIYKHQNNIYIVIQAFALIVLIKHDKDINILTNEIIDNKNLTPETEYYLFFSTYQHENCFIDRLEFSKETREFIAKIVIEFTYKNHYKDIYTGGNYRIHRKALQWLKQIVLFEEGLTPDVYKPAIQAFKKLAFSDSTSSEIRVLAKEALESIQTSNYVMSSDQSESKSEKKKEVLEIFQTKNLAEQAESIIKLLEEDPNEIIDLWIQWIIDFDSDKASLARITSDKIRTSKNAVIPLVSQLEQGWQPHDDLKLKIRNKIVENEKNLLAISSKFEDSNSSNSERKKILDDLQAWLSSIKENPNVYSEQIRSEFDKKQTDKQLAIRIVEILVHVKIDRYALQVQRRIARQLADMSDDRFFGNSSKEYDEIKDELRKHAVPALARRLPKEADIEIRESMARVLGNVGGTFAVDALAQAVVGEERTRTARQDLLAKYYLEPSKARSEEAAIILKSAVEEAKKTLWMQQWLNIITFGTGIFLLVGGTVISISSDDYGKRIASGVAGVGGLAGVITQFVTNPLKRIQNAMSNLIQAETAFTSFIWELNLNGTYIQSQYVAEGVLSNEEIAQTVSRIENSMNLTMNLVSEHLNSDNQGVFPRLKSLVPSITEIGKPITIYGQNLMQKNPNRLIAINHKLIKPDTIISWNENTVKFTLPPESLSIDAENKSVWVSLFVDGIESNVLPLQVLKDSTHIDVNPDKNSNSSV